MSEPPFDRLYVHLAVRRFIGQQDAATQKLLLAGLLKIREGRHRLMPQLFSPWGRHAYLADLGDFQLEIKCSNDGRRAAIIGIARKP